MTINHIDQLAEWFDNAEDGDIHQGDTFIRHLPEVGRFIVGVADRDLGAHPHRHVLARAPKPKPAWHDAVAVRARWEDPSGDESEPFDGVDTFVNSGDGWWIGGYDNARPAEELHDVTPLIEAKVTDEMVTRAHAEMLRRGLGDYSNRALASIIAAALGLETE